MKRLTCLPVGSVGFHFLQLIFQGFKFFIHPHHPRHSVLLHSFKPSVDTVKWLKRAGIRALKTMAQTAVGVIGAGSVISAVDWKMVTSAAVVAGVVSILTSVAGIPEVEAEEGE